MQYGSSLQHQRTDISRMMHAARCLPLEKHQLHSPRWGNGWLSGSHFGRAQCMVRSGRINAVQTYIEKFYIQLLTTGGAIDRRFITLGAHRWVGTPGPGHCRHWEWMCDIFADAEATPVCIGNIIIQKTALVRLMRWFYRKLIWTGWL